MTFATLVARRNKNRSTKLAIAFDKRLPWTCHQQILTLLRYLRAGTWIMHDSESQTRLEMPPLSNAKVLMIDAAVSRQSVSTLVSIACCMQNQHVHSCMTVELMFALWLALAIHYHACSIKTSLVIHFDKFESLINTFVHISSTVIASMQ